MLLCRLSSSSCVFSCVGNSLEQVNAQSSFAVMPREAAKALAFVQLSAVSLSPHDALAVSVCHWFVPFTYQAAETELFNMCIVYFWDS